MGVLFWVVLGIAGFKIGSYVLWRVSSHARGYRYQVWYDNRGRRRTERYHISE